MKVVTSILNFIGIAYCALLSITQANWLLFVVGSVFIVSAYIALRGANKVIIAVVAVPNVLMLFAGSVLAYYAIKQWQEQSDPVIHGVMVLVPFVLIAPAAFNVLAFWSQWIMRSDPR